MDEKKRKQKGLRADGRVQVVLVIGHREDNGKPITKSFYGKTWTEANKKREDYKLNMKLGIAENPNMKVGDWVDTCLKLYRNNVNKAYADNDAVPYRRLKREIGRMPLRSVRNADLQKLLNDIGGKSFSTISKYYHAMFLVFDKARRNKLILDNPAENLILPNGTEGSHRALERWESECIMTNWRLHRAGIWALLMMLCGIRRGEMIALRWENVDLEKRVIHVREVGVVVLNKTIIEERAKSNAGIRDLPICDELYEALLETPEDKRAGLICVSAKGKQLTQSAFDRGWDGFNLAMQRVLNGEPVIQQGRRVSQEKKVEAARAAGKEYVLFKIRAHDLRHTYATALYDCGVDIKTAQYLLGHSDIRMTMDLYTHLSNERREAQNKQVIDMLNGWVIGSRKNDENQAEKQGNNDDTK